MSHPVELVKLMTVRMNSVSAVHTAFNALYAPHPRGSCVKSKHRQARIAADQRVLDRATAAHAAACRAVVAYFENDEGAI